MNLAPSPPALPAAASQTRTVVRFLDFSCAGGSSGLAWRLWRVPGVGDIAFTPRDDAVTVTYDPARTNLAELEFVVAAAGYRLQ